jgi:hypothetical protein
MSHVGGGALGGGTVEKYIAVVDISTEGFSTNTQLASGALVVVLLGNADMKALHALQIYTRQLHEEAVRVACRRVDVDIRALYFMNSSCLKALVVWIAAVRDLPAEKRYAIHFLSNSHLAWQRRSLTSLQSFAADIVDFAE